MTHDEFLLGRTNHRMPVFSWVGIISLILSLLMFGFLSIRNETALERIEDLNQEQASFTAARAPAARLSTCNLLRIAVTVVPPTDQERREALKVLEQNIESLQCPDGIVEISNPVPIVPTTSTTR